MKKPPRDKYATGTSVKGYIETPMEALMENQINLVKAQVDAAGNPLVQGLDVAGNLAMLTGSALAGKVGSEESKKFDTDFADSFGKMLPILGNTNFALGGKVPGIPVEIEGEEIIETPDGQVAKAKGPNHENGGVDVDLPEGTDVYSDRILRDGKTMAKRKENRVKKEITLESLLEMDSTDVLTKNSLKRTKETNVSEDAADNKIQNLIKDLSQAQEILATGGKVKGKGMYALGGPVLSPDEWLKSIGSIQTQADLIAGGLWDKYATKYQQSQDIAQNNLPDFGEIFPEEGDDPSLLSTTNTSTFDDIISGIDGVEDAANTSEFNLGNINIPGTVGDFIGLASNIAGPAKQKRLTRENRAGDTPNINAFKEFGTEGLQALEDAAGFVEVSKDDALTDIDLGRTGQIKRGRNTARGINQMRALDISAEQVANKARGDIYSQFADKVAGLYTTKAGLENQQDQAVMSGEAARDLADRADRDNYYSNLAINLASETEGLQETSRDLNAIKYNEEIGNLVNQLSKYGIKVKDGTLYTDKK